MPGLFSGTPLERPVTCEHCNQPDCTCPRNAAGEPCPPHLQHPRVRREKRRGKWTTVVADIHAAHEPNATDLKPLLKALRTTLGTGGGLAQGTDSPEIILQGDHKEAAVEHLASLGYRVKPAGG